MTEELKLDLDKKISVKKVIKTLFILFILFVLLLIFAYNFLLSKVSNDKTEIKKGTGVYKAGILLKEKGIIRNYTAYKIYVKLHNINEYKIGTYTLSKSMTTRKIVSILNGNDYKNNYISITFKEGIKIDDICDLIINNTSITKEEFYDKLKDETYINSLIEKYWFLTDEIKNKDIYYPLEGYLFADTYSFDKDLSLEDIFKVMLDQTDKVLSKYKESINKKSYSVHNLVTLASVIEKEGIYKDDRKDIAGVFYNRLKNNMPLGSDVTTYYALKVKIGQRDLTSNEFNTSNSYNTRGPNMNGKLPVGPICNFSISSLDASINPNSNNYLYFVADKNGKTYFSITYQEHEKTVKEIKASGNWIEF